MITSTALAAGLLAVLTFPGLVFFLLAIAIAFAGGIWYTRDQLKRNPEKFLQQIARAKLARDRLRIEAKLLEDRVKEMLGSVSADK